MLKIPATTPKLYSTDGTSFDDKTIHARLFALGSAATWLIAEYDPDERVVFCYCDLYGTGPQGGAEWGYTSLEELEELKFGLIPRVEVDAYFTPKPFKECISTGGLIY